MSWFIKQFNESEESIGFQNQVENLEKKSKQQSREIKTLSKQINEKEYSISSLNQLQCWKLSFFNNNENLIYNVN